jgi:hypothetical protein
LYPVCFLPKTLHYDFSLTVDGKAAPLVNRAVDTRIAVDVLVELGASHNQGERPPRIVLAVLEEIVAAFPWSSDAERLRSPLARSVVEEGAEAGMIDPEVAATTWWRNAVADPAWSRLVTELAHNFILLVPLEATASGMSVVKVKSVEPLEPEGDQFLPLAEADGRLNFPVQVAFHGCGRAMSEHFRIAAPERMFFSGDLFSHVDVNHWRRESKNAVVYYSDCLPQEQVTILAILSPEQRSFAVPAGVIPIVSTAALVLGKLFPDVLHQLSGRSTAVSATVLFLPSAALAYINKSDDHAMRWHALRFVRRLAWFSISPLLAAFFLLTPDSAVWPGGDDFVDRIWTLLLVVSGVLLIWLVIPVAQLFADEKAQTEREGKLTEYRVEASDAEPGLADMGI